MKIILTGCTGFIGGATLARCLAHPSITSIVVLTRRPLQTTHSKLTTIILSSFLPAGYTPEVITQLKGAEACIWSMGTPTSGREVHYDFTFAAARTFLENLRPSALKTGKKPFRFIYVSGFVVERDQQRNLWFMSEARKMRGTVEMGLVAMEKESEGAFQAVAVRPGYLHRAKMGLPGGLMVSVLPTAWHVAVEEFAAATVEMGISGDGGHSVENAELKTKGRVALEQIPWSYS
ncbi:hypothetical protein LTR62_000019 [Meristemomyces frigidus]|uniref:NAD(P)-binding domain-containing protein n=1 Tax=Meristemomyces frigidus TaxID=1508187 RepID=A0AAN7YJY6_9PEZI|nr:hypothetical protein LTR62_000019 [Meristemomyces frigidus]